MPEYVTMPVLAGAYRGKRADLASTLTHTVNTTRAAWVVLCGGVNPDHLCPDFEREYADKPTCPRCFSKDPRFNPKKESPIMASDLIKSEANKSKGNSVAQMSFDDIADRFFAEIDVHSATIKERLDVQIAKLESELASLKAKRRFLSAKPVTERSEETEVDRNDRRVQELAETRAPRKGRKAKGGTLDVEAVYKAIKAAGKAGAAKSDVMESTGITDGQWARAVKELDTRIKMTGNRRSARYTAK